jgi:hypothetical protein
LSYAYHKMGLKVRIELTNTRLQIGAIAALVTSAKVEVRIRVELIPELYESPAHAGNACRPM